MWFRYLKNSVAILTLTAAVACAPVTMATRIDPAESLVDARLREAGETITKDLAILAGSTQHRDHYAHASTGDLQTRMTLNWRGPIEGALTMVAAHIGYKFSVSGTPPVTPLFVHVKMLDRSALLILREIGLQTGKEEGVKLDEIQRSIRLIYGPEVKE